jgi:hypothetical protein
VSETNGFNNTKYPGGMYSDADHIWTNGIFYFIGFLSHNIGISLWELALEWRFSVMVGSGWDM